MAKILTFDATRKTPKTGECPINGGQLVAMKHIDLDAVTDTVRVLRELGRDGLLDKFNRNRQQA